MISVLEASDVIGAGDEYISLNVNKIDSVAPSQSNSSQNLFTQAKKEDLVKLKSMLKPVVKNDNNSRNSHSYTNTSLLKELSSIDKEESKPRSSLKVTSFGLNSNTTTPLIQHKKSFSLSEQIVEVYFDTDQPPENRSIKTSNDVLPTELENKVVDLGEVSDTNSKLPGKKAIKALDRQDSLAEKVFSISEGSKSILRVYDSKRILKFDLEYQQFSFIKFIDFDGFEGDFIASNSLYLNSPNGLFIVTGENCNMFYFYNSRKRTMTKLAKLSYCHSAGGLIYCEKDNSIICLSGKDTRKVERYYNNDILTSFSSPRSKQSKNMWTELTEMAEERSNSAYIIINNTCIYTFFGYCHPKRKYLETIERLDISEADNVTWERVFFKNIERLGLAMKSHAVINVEKDRVLFLGGYDANKNVPIAKFMEFYPEEASLVPLQREYPEIIDNQIYTFNGDTYLSHFTEKSNNNYLAGFDDAGRVHCIETKDINYSIFSFQ